MTITERTHAGLALALANFEAEYGAIVRNALALQAEHMREMTAECIAPLTALPGQQPVPPEPSRQNGATTLTIDITPTASGLRNMAGAFTESADRADAALAAYEELAGLAAELDNGE
jgi:hypothetical protein